MAVGTVGISDATYYKWCKLYAGMGKLKPNEFKSLAKQNERLKRIVN
ncbi:MAG: transposase [Rhodospirillales bacterium]